MRRAESIEHMKLSSVLLLLLALPLFAAQRANKPSSKHNSGQVGLQLYSLRNQFQADVPGTVDQVRSFGIKYVELAGTYGLEPQAFNDEVKAKGLQAISAHYSYEQFRDHIDDVVREAKVFALEYVGCAWIDHPHPLDEKTVREMARVFNRAGELLAKNNLKFFYHIHGYEFAPYENGTLFDLLAKETNPRYVKFQMDVYWVVNAEQDPVKLLKRYGKRFVLMHLKDMKQGTPRNLLGETDIENNVSLGQGIIQWADVTRAAKEAGVKWYFLEDESSRSVAQIPESLRFIQTLKL
jgi:sugar phosphate isomerase/epimerase